ncbi:MAG: FGGY-family carbohydrate kinase [Armatimonadota bacterium]
MGIDVGTQGARVIVSNESGQVAAIASRSFSESVNVKGIPQGWFEQDPEQWWSAVTDCLQEVVGRLSEIGRQPSDIVAIAVDSTSGTILPIDSSGRALRAAIMYSDSRAEEEAVRCNEEGHELVDKLGYKFGSSFGLPKLLWLKRHEPDTWKRCWKVIHAADFIVGKLTGKFGISDHSNSLKTGYDLVEFCWPSFISERLKIEPEKLPDVITPGCQIGCVTAECADYTGICQGTAVVAGVSDGTAGFIASGASEVGDWNTTLGTTLVLRGVSEDLIRDSEGRVYCHRHPDGWWLPGGASNTGGECLVKLFAGSDYRILDERATCLIPSNRYCYPLVRCGERLPIVSSEARGFFPEDCADSAELYTACLEGVAYVERWCYELMEELGSRVGNVIYSTGGGAKSRTWLSIRASILNRQILSPAVADSAMGTAIVAASRILYHNLSEATRAMVRYDTIMDPCERLVEPYELGYQRFRRECASRGLGIWP